MIVIGEKLNSSIPKTRELMAAKDHLALQELARLQVESGADYIDINAGTFISTETEMLSWLVELVQEVTDKPLCIDTTNVDALAAALRLAKKPALINSISLEGTRFEDVSKLALKYGSSVIGLCQTGEKIPDCAEERVSAGIELAERLREIGIPEENIYLDPLVNAVAVNQQAAMTVFHTIAGLKAKVPFAKIVCGLSNVGFGLPKRRLINRTFLAMLTAAGLDGAIIDPLDQELMEAVYASDLLAGKDFRCRRYLKKFR